MKSYPQSMIAETQTDDAAYIQFVTGKGREGFSAYAFVEDDDDIVFYQHVLDDIDNISFIGCGGKTGVLSVFRKMASDGTASDQLFFVDRDTEQLPFEYGEDVLRTNFYSWESHLCQERLVLRFLQRRAKPNLTPAECKLVAESWRNTVNNFSDDLASHTALVLCSSECEPTLGMRKVSLTRNCSTADMQVHPCRITLDAILSEKIELAENRGISRATFSSRKEHFLKLDPLHTSKGKTLYQIFREFSLAVSAYLKRKIITDVGNISLVLATMSSNDQDVEYIKIYCRRRIGSNVTNDM